MTVGKGASIFLDDAAAVVALVESDKIASMSTELRWDTPARSFTGRITPDRGGAKLGGRNIVKWITATGNKNASGGSLGGCVE